MTQYAMPLYAARQSYNYLIRDNDKTIIDKFKNINLSIAEQQSDVLFVERSYMHNCHFILLNNFSFYVSSTKVALFRVT